MVLPIILGTRSSGRRELADKAGLRYEAKESPYDDPPGVPVECDTVAAVSILAMIRALHKAVALTTPLDGPAVIVTADTMCADHAAILGKAASPEEAAEVIQRFAAGKQTVVTAAVIAVAYPKTRTLSIKHANVYAADVVCGEQPAREGIEWSSMVEEWITSGLWKGCSGSIRVEDMVERGWPLTFKTFTLPVPTADAAAAAVGGAALDDPFKDVRLEAGVCVGVHEATAAQFGGPLALSALTAGGAREVQVVPRGGAHDGGACRVVLEPLTGDVVAMHQAPAEAEVPAVPQQHLFQVVVGFPISVLRAVIAAAECTDDVAVSG